MHEFQQPDQPHTDTDAAMTDGIVLLMHKTPLDHRVAKHGCMGEIYIILVSNECTG
jgi:hypothetical protein